MGPLSLPLSLSLFLHRLFDSIPSHPSLPEFVKCALKERGEVCGTLCFDFPEHDPAPRVTQVSGPHQTKAGRRVQVPPRLEDLDKKSNQHRLEKTSGVGH